MDTALLPAAPAPFWRRAWDAVVRALPRRIPKTESDHSAGVDFAEDMPANAEYDVRQAMSAFAAFPWNYAAVSAVAADFAGLPWVVSRGRGARAERLDDHPLLALLDRPSTQITGEELWRQIIVDLRHSGEFFLLRIGVPRTTSLLRLHPARVTPLPLRDGQPGDFRMADGVVYPAAHVLYGRLPSWGDGPEGLRGTGAIQPLHNALNAVLAAQQNAARSAKIGRPTGILRPSDPSVKWDEKQVKRVRLGWEQQLGGRSGVVIIGEGSAEYQSLGWSPADLEYVAQEELTRDQILAVHDVPPTRVGIPNANYATDEAQSARYWQGMQGLARLVCGKLTLLAQQYEPGLVVSKDFSGVQELQAGRTSRQERVKIWVELGLDLADAAAYEGFDDLPAATSTPTSSPAATPAEEEGEEERALVSAALRLAGLDRYAWVAPVLARFAQLPEGEAPSLLTSVARVYDPDHARALLEEHDAAADPLAAVCQPHLRACLEAGGRPRAGAERLAVMLREALAGQPLAELSPEERAVARARWLIVGADGHAAQRVLALTWETRAAGADWLRALPLELVEDAA